MSPTHGMEDYKQDLIIHQQVMLESLWMTPTLVTPQDRERQWPESYTSNFLNIGKVFQNQKNTGLSRNKQNKI